MLGFTVFALYVEVGKGCYLLLNLSDSKIGVAVYSYGWEMVFPPTSLHEWLLNYNKTYDIPY